MGLLLGAVALVAAGIALAGFAVRSAVLLHRDESRRPPSVASAGWHVLLGYGIVAAGALIWIVLGAFVDVASSSVLSQASADDEEPPAHVLEAERLTMFVREARWAAILLAVGGLVLLARSTGRRLAVSGVVVAWVVADLTL